MKELPLKCPCNEKATLLDCGDGYKCSNQTCIHNKRKFQLIEKKPILISEEKTDTIFESKDAISYVSRSGYKVTRLKKFFIGESPITKKNALRFVNDIFTLAEKPKVLVIGGAEKGAGTEAIYDNPDIELHAVDIYASELVDLVCDAHYLPLDSDFYDGVWIQAVLEHVVEPQKVVAEIYRVLKHGGIVYAETPFMQQVHEGAYDFTRFTVLGHRYLFKEFESIDIGGNKGPEMVLAWSIKYLIWGLSRSRKLAQIASVLFSFLLRPLGYFVSDAAMYDASSGVYFLGRKGSKQQLTHKALVGLYKGQVK